MESEKTIYFKGRAEELQNSIVNVNRAATATIESYTWTFRTSACDVISIITTTVPLKNGTIKEINLHNKEMRRIKAPLRKPGTFLSGHPLKGKFVNNEHTARLRKNEALWSEHKSFMKKLQISRYLKSTVETLAATYIQKAYRGYYIRTRRDELERLCIFRRNIRRKIRDYIFANDKSNGLGIVLTHGEHRGRFKKWQYRAAVCIQRGFRRFFNRKRLSAIRVEINIERRRRAAIRLQCFARQVLASRKVSLVRSIRLDFMRSRGARLLQSQFRCLMARRRMSRRMYSLQWLAARMIQSCYRIYRVAVLLKIMRQRTIDVKSFNGALALQCLVRQRIAFFKVNSLSTARFLFRVRSYASKIQALIRGFIVRARVRKEHKSKGIMSTCAKPEVKRLSNFDVVNSLRGKVKNQSKATIKEGIHEDDLNISRHKGSVKGTSTMTLFRAETKLISAIVMQDLEEIRAFLISNPPSSDVAVSAMTTAILSYSPSACSLAVLMLLFELNLGSSINKAHKESGCTVLQLASQMGHFDVVQLLLANGADTEVTDSTQHTALHKACRPTVPTSSALSMVQLLLGVEGTSDGGWRMNSDQAAVACIAGSASGITSASGSTKHSSADSSGTFLEICGVTWQSPLLGSLSATQTPLIGSHDNQDLGDRIAGDGAEPSTWSTRVLREEHTLRMAAALSSKGLDGKDCLLIAAISGQTAVLEFALRVMSEARCITKLAADVARVAEVDRVEKARIEAQAKSEAVLLQAAELAAAVATLTDIPSLSEIKADGIAVGISTGFSGPDLTVLENAFREKLSHMPSIPELDPVDPFAATSEDMEQCPLGDGALSDANLDEILDFIPINEPTQMMQDVEIEEAEKATLSDGIINHSLLDAVMASEIVKKTSSSDDEETVDNPLPPVTGIERVWSRRGTMISEKEVEDKVVKVEVDQIPERHEEEKVHNKDEEIQDEINLATPRIVDIVTPPTPMVPVVWTDDDTQCALHLSKTGNIQCLVQLLDTSFDPTHTLKSGTTLAMAAAEEGHIAVLDLLMGRGLDLSVRDFSGQTVMHYAAMCSSEDVTAYLLTHEYTTKCRLSELGLVEQDCEGSTPLHIAAKSGVPFYLDLLAPKGIELAMLARDKKGLTPLLLACSYKEVVVIKNYLNLGADAKAVDNNGHSAIWHLYHPSSCAKSSGKADSSLRPIASEWTSRIKEGPVLSQSTSEVGRVASEVGTIASLIRAGCPFFSVPYSISTSLSAAATEPMRALRTPRLLEECCDTATKELSVTLFKFIPRLLSSQDCWRVVLSSIRLYDDVNARMFCALMAGGAAERMLLEPQIDISSPEGLLILNAVDPLRKRSKILSIPNPGNTEESGQESATEVGSCHMKATLLDLQCCFFGGFTVGGWSVRLGSLQVVEHVLSTGYDPTRPADILGNSMVHIAAKYGSPAMVDAVCAPRDHRIDFEALNLFGWTAAMEGARAGNSLGVGRLVSLGANARKGLEGSCCAWLLLLVRKDEKEKEIKKKLEKSEKKNLQQSSGDEINKIAVLNAKKLMKNKKFVLNSFDINILREKTRQLLADKSCE